MRIIGVMLVFVLLAVSSSSSPQTTPRGSSKSPTPATRHATRFFKAEHGTGADYLKVAACGTYRLMAREHMGVILTEKGQWEQKGAVLTFRPRTLMSGGKYIKAEGAHYEGTEVGYKGKTFIAWDSEDAAGIVIPVEDTKQELDSDPKNLPLYVFFKITAKAYARETREPYPFRYLGPDSAR